METELEKILVYLGPSLSLAKAREILPEAIYRRPARQGDLVSDVVNLSPNRIILIDGEFRQNLSVWHKELVYALQYPGVKAVYGAASMGALRAAELDFLGMIGIGQIYEWYRDGLTEDDSEVALCYATRESADGPLYYPSTIPLVDIRAGCATLSNRRAAEFLVSMEKLFYMDRTRSFCEHAWGGEDFPYKSQKEADAIEALANFSSYPAAHLQLPTPENLSSYFAALYERDRRIQVNGIEVPQQHIDAHVLLHNPEWERICWDASNQELALVLCNVLCITVSVEEIQAENARFQTKAEISKIEDFQKYLEANGWSHHEYDRVMIQNARIRKLQHHLTVTKMYRRNTQALIDYLRTHQAFDFWAEQAAALEKRIQARGSDDWLSINLDTPAIQQLLDHFEKEGLELKSSPEDYLLETGFSNFTELSVAVQRSAAGKEN